MSLVVCVFLGVFCFKQKTAYEMRISDWSSDVCSSDLLHLQVVPEHLIGLVQMERGAGLLLHRAGCQEVVQVRMGMDDAHHLQAMGVESRHDQFRKIGRAHV